MSDGFLKSQLVNDSTRNVLAGNCQEMLALALTVRFLTFNQDSITVEDVKNFHHDLKDTGSACRYVNNDPYRIIQISGLTDGQCDVFWLDKICTFVNEDPDLKQAYLTWVLNDVEHGYVSIIITSNSVLLDIKMQGMTDYRKRIVPRIKRNSHYVYVVGKNSLNKDHGFVQHVNFFEQFCGIEFNNPKIHTWYNGNLKKDFSDENILKQNKNLFKEVSNELNKVLSTDKSILKNIAMSIHSNFGGQKGFEYDILEFDNTNYQIYVIKYQGVEDCMMQYKNIRTNVKKTLSPTLEFIDESGQNIFNICLRREKFPSSVTGYRYKAYVEPSKELMENITN